MLDSGAPYYDTYECADGRYMSIGSIEPQFYAELLKGLGLDGEDLPAQQDVSRWPEFAGPIAEVFRLERPRPLGRGVRRTDACATPVLSFAEVENEPHITARDTFYRDGEVLLPSPAPRFSRSAPSTPRPLGEPGTGHRIRSARLELAARD